MNAASTWHVHAIATRVRHTGLANQPMRFSAKDKPNPYMGNNTQRPEKPHL